MMNTIFERELAGETITPDDSDYPEIIVAIEHAFSLTAQLNGLYYKHPDVQMILAELFGHPLDPTSILIPPFYTDFGRNTRIGANCFIQQGCTFFDRGGIIIGDGVMIGPKVNLITLNHDLTPGSRAATICRPIILEDDVWIGVNATILPGITVGRSAVVAAGSVVTKDVPAYAVVGGNPARILRMLK